MINGARNFVLKNELGEIIDISTPGHGWLWQPAGLGWGREVEVSEVGNTYIVIDEREKRPNPSGTMVFKGYEEYAEFLRFIQSAKILSLGYRPTNTDAWRWLDCVAEIEKTEIDHEYNRLLCAITFSSISHWYELLTYKSNAVQVDDDGMTYTYKYPYYYETLGTNVFSVDNGGLPSYFRLTVYGRAINPEYRVYVNNNVVKSGRIEYEVTAGRMLIIDTRPSRAEISEYTTSGDYLNDIYPYSDYTTQRFFALPPGSSRFAVISDDAAPIATILEVFKRV